MKEEFKRLKYYLLFGLLLLLIIGNVVPVDSTNHRNGPTNVNNDPMKESMKEKAMSLSSSYFIQNKGQIDSEEIQFYSRGGNVFFTPTCVIYRFREMEPNEDEGMELDRFSDPMKDPPETFHEWGVILKYSFIRANKVIPVGRERCNWNTNYFKGSDQEKWYTEVPNYLEVIYPDLWDGIDLVYRLKDGSIKYDLIVHPDADLSDIRIQIDGANDLSINPQGDLVIRTKYWDILDSGLVSYYEDGSGGPIPCKFELMNDYEYKISLGAFDKSRSVVIDPVIHYSTFIGGSGYDIGSDIAIDTSGNAYITGWTEDAPTYYPTTTGAFDTTHNGGNDVFVTKLNSAGSSLVYSTFIGGSGDDEGVDIAIDTSGNAYITGYTNDDTTDYPITSGAYDTTQNGIWDVFVTKLNSAGSSLVYSTFIGGSERDVGEGIAIDTSGNAYITGWTEDAPTYYPTTTGAFDTTHNGGNDVFVTKLNSAGSSLEYSTFIGGSGSDSGSCIEIDTNGNVYISGLTRDGTTDYPTTPGAYDTTHNGDRDVFVTKLNSAGSSLVYSTFIGGSGYDYGGGIAIDTSGNAYITGNTVNAPTSYPITTGAYDSTHNGNYDVFVTKLNSAGSSLMYSTFIGGSSDDVGRGIAIDTSGNAYITGYTTDGNVDYPTTTGAYDTTHNRVYDVFVTKLNSVGSSLLYSTFIGGSDIDYGDGIAIDTSENAYLTGYTRDGTFDYPTTTGAFDTTHNGNSDVFVSVMSLVNDVSPPVFSSDNSTLSATTGDRFTFSIEVTDNIEVSFVSVEYWFGSGNPINHSLLGLGPFTHTITIPTDSTETLHYIFHAKDKVDNWNLTEQRDVKVLDDDEVIFGTDSTPGTAVTGDQFAIGIQVTDNIAVSAVWIEYWFGESAHKNVTMSGNGVYIYLLPIPLNSTESLHYIIHANDTSNNWNMTVVSDVIIIDNDQPYFGTLSMPVIIGTGEILVCSIQVFDNVVIYAVYFEYWFGWGYHTNVTMLGTSPYSFDVAIPENSIDPLDYIISAVDGSGNWISISDEVAVIDTIGPISQPGPDLLINEDSPTPLNGALSSDNIRIVKWTWKFLDGDVAVILYGMETGYIFNQPGKYRIFLNVSDAAGNWQETLFNITVKDITDPVIEVSSLEVDEDTVVTFNGSRCNDNVGIVNWTWSFKDGNMDILLYGSSKEYTFIMPGIYNINLTVSDDAENKVSTFFLVTVKDVTQPVVDAGSDRTVPEGSVVTLEASGSNNVVIVNWTWTFDAGVGPKTLFGESISNKFSIPGNYTITLTVRDEAGNNATDTMMVNVTKITETHDGEDETGDKSIWNYWWIVIILLVVLIMIFVVFFVVRRKKTAELSERIPAETTYLVPLKATEVSSPQEVVKEGSETTYPLLHNIHEENINIEEISTINNEKTDVINTPMSQEAINPDDMKSI